MLNISKEVRDIKRFKEILTVLFEEGFDFIIEKIRLKHKIPLTKRLKARVEKKKNYSIEKRLRLTLERLGPTFIKFGQVLSVRPDLAPKSYIKELEDLQDNVPPFAFSLVKEQIKKELGKDINQIFSKFEEKPIASASISQVHKAILKNGISVAVKVQRPDVKKIMETDIEVMHYVAYLLEKRIPKIRKFSPVKIIEEFAAWTEKELDFTKEAMNAKRFARNFSGDKTIRIPKIYDEFTTNKILVMEFIDGTSLHNLTKIKDNKNNRGNKRKINLVIEHGFNALLTQVFIHGFFHADPHPGNIIVTKDNKIAFVDFGIVGYFDEELKAKSIELFYGIIQNDAGKVADALVELSGNEIEDISGLKQEITSLLEPLQNSEISKVKISHVLEEVLDVSLNYAIRIPAPFVLFGKTVITLEGIALEYDPEFTIVESSKLFIKKFMRQRYNPANMLANFIKNIARFKKFADELPEQASRALKKIEKGNLKIDIEDTDIKKLSSEIDKSSNRIAYSMLIAALLIVAALTMNFGKPFIFNLPLISFLSFLIAAVLSFILIISIIREREVIK
ncbi:AarF/ABC1/UbiB kinase family protein [Candidatus Woesearchaeota archaeon]|nr:AarF/ABC1/UbiB kinase family protein [Candidatus Woesearchaeota archaeon]